MIGKKLAGLLDFLSDEKVELVVSQELLNEVLEVASRPKLKKPEFKQTMQQCRIHC